MAKIDENSIAKLKALFQDNEKALGSNFSRLIDFFNDNKVTDNGDGTFSVGNTIINVNDIVQEPEVRSIILSQLKASTELATKEQLDTKADISAIDSSLMVKRVQTSDDDILSLDPGTYWVWGTAPKNYPTSVSWGTVVVKLSPISTNGNNKLVEVTDVSRNQLINTYAGSPLTWSGWQVPNSSTLASKSDVTTAISAATASKADDSKVVHTKDMRKPASDVAGIEEVTAKQDKIGYTPADDSKVVHTTSNETIAGQKKFDTDPTDSVGNAYAKTVDVNQQLDKKVNIADMRKPANDVAGIEEVNAKQDKIGYTPADDSKVVHTSDMRKPAGNVAGIDEVNSKQDKIGYKPADDSKVVHTSDMRKPASDVAGIEEVNAKQDKLTITPADDAKVVHNTGSEEISGQKTFDITPIDKATGNPYITKADVPTNINTGGSAIANAVTYND